MGSINERPDPTIISPGSTSLYSTLPMTFRLDGFSLEALTSHVEEFKASFSIDEDIIKSFVATVSESINEVDVSYGAFLWMD